MILLAMNAKIVIMFQKKVFLLGLKSKVKKRILVKEKLMMPTCKAYATQNMKLKNRANPQEPIWKYHLGQMKRVMIFQFEYYVKLFKQDFEI